MKSLFKTVALITIFSFATRILGFVFRIVLSRTIGAEALGLSQVASSVFMVLLTIISSGIPFVISRISASFRAEKQGKKASSFLSVALIFTLLLSLVICLIVLACQGLFAKLFTDKGQLPLLLVLLPSLVFSAIYCVFRGDLWGQGNYFALCITEFYEQVIRIVLSLLVISSSLSAFDNAMNLGWTMSLACFFSMLFVIALFFFYGGKLSKPQKVYLKPFLAQSAPITLMRVASSFVGPLVALIIPARLMAIGYTSSQALALYGVAMGMTMPLLFIPTTILGSLSTALVPDISTAIAQNNHNHIERRINFSLSFALAISALFVPLFLGMGEQIGLFLYDNALSGSLLQAAAWVLIPLALNGMTSSLLNSLGLENKSFKNFIIGAVAMFLALWFLPQLLGINALVFGMGINYLISFILNLRLLKKHTKVETKLGKLFLKYLIAIVPAAAMTSFVVSICEYFMPLFFTLIVGACIGMTCFITLCCTLNLIDIKAVYVEVKRKFKVRSSERKPKKKGIKT
ncbi:MAG: oligosaccharide flippase family protein [Clostridia bacterium]|nr:oligosaccharide flippase family protein [Clostridia bacterium]